MKPANRRITISDVAERAGVSKSTVSRYLQGSPRLSDASRRAISEAITALNYHPSSAARTLTQRRTGAVGVLVEDLQQPWFTTFIQPLVEVLYNHGFHMIVGDLKFDTPMGGDVVRTFSERSVDGVVVAGTITVTDALRAMMDLVPTVVAGPHDFDDAPIDIVIPDDDLAATMVMNHLWELGHRRIVHIAGPASLTFEIRRRAYECFMEEHGARETIRVARCDTTEEGGRRAALSLLARPDQRPTAVFVANDNAALGAMAATAELGIDVPADLSIASIDNTFLAQNYRIDLTSVDTRIAELGRTAGQMLIRRIADRDLPRQLKILDAPILWRRSSTAVNASGAAAHVADRDANRENRGDDAVGRSSPLPH